MCPTTLCQAFSSLAAVALVAVAHAANIPFSNCLNASSNETTSGVSLLQFIPYYVNATFDADAEGRPLYIQVYGNISGSIEVNKSIPTIDANPGYWTNPNNTQGKIVDLGYNTTNLTTLRNTYYVATNVAKRSPALDFCDQTLQGCPLAPVNGNASMNELPQFNYTQRMDSGWGLSTIQAILYATAGNDPYYTSIVCVSAEVTPYIGDTAASLLRYLPVLVLLLTFLATASAVFSPWGTWNIYHWSSNYGRDEDQLRLITPGFGDCLSYIQFVVLSGSLALRYPGFYQPAVSQVSWSALMFNQSFYSHHGYNPVVDNLYELTNPSDSLGQYNGMTTMRQLVGMGSDNDIWPGAMIWLLVVIACLLVLIQLVYGARVLYRFATNTQEEDLRSKNWPMSVGNVIRVVFNYFLLPVLAFSIYQIALVAQGAPGSLGAPAAITLLIVVVFAAWLLWQILSTHPRSLLFDNLPTLLMIGPLYNTYSDAYAPFALMPMLANLLRSLAIGAVQQSGIGQIVLMALAEVVLLLGMTIGRPFSSPTSMNLYHTGFAVVRLVTLFLMLAFAPQVNAPYGAKSWIAYVILFLHGLVLVFGFLLHSLVTFIEVSARALGLGGDETSNRRGGLVKVFGVRQLSRRHPTRSKNGRGSMASNAAMLDQDADRDSAFARHSGMRSRSASASSHFLLNSRTAASGRQSMVMDNLSQAGALDGAPSSAGQSRGPGTPSGAASVFSYVPSASQVAFDSTNRRASGMTVMTGTMAGQRPPEPADPYYRPPRTRRPTNEILGSPATFGRSSAASGDWSSRGNGHVAAGDDAGFSEGGVDLSGSPPAIPGYTRARADSGAEDLDTPKPDYATREVDYYYGVRGPALNDQPTRKLKTGPADPTGPVSSATGWFQKVFGGKSKDKHKSFEVVRGKGVRQGMNPIPTGEPEVSPREVVEPYTDEPGTPIPEATTAPRKLDLEDEADAIGAGTRHIPDEQPRVSTALEELGIARLPSNAPMLPDIETGSSIHVPSRFPSQASKPAVSVRYRDEDAPVLPRNFSRGPTSATGGLQMPRSNSRALSTIAQSPAPSASASPLRKTGHTTSGGLSRMPFGSLGSTTARASRPNSVHRAGSMHSEVSAMSQGQSRSSSQQPPSPIEPPRQLIDANDPISRRESSGSIGYVNQHRASDNIIHPTSQALFSGSQAELVDDDPDRSQPQGHSGAHTNF